MRVLGIDCGVERTGYGVIESDGRTHRLLAAGVIRTSPRDALEARLLLIAVGRVAEQLLDGLVGQDAAVEERVENRVVQRLHRAVVVVRGPGAVRILKAARQQQVGELRHQILQIQLVEVRAREFRVAVLHSAV